MIATLDTAITIHEKSSVIDPTALLLIIHSLLTEDAQKAYLKQYIPESLVEQMYHYLGTNLVELNRKYLESLHQIKQAFVNPPDDSHLKQIIEDLFNIIPQDLAQSLSAELEKQPTIQLDNWLFSIPLTVKEEGWLMEQIERLRIFEEVKHA